MSLKELRLKRGMTQKQLAEHIGISQQGIARYETGERDIANMTLANAIRLCDALKVSNPRKLLDD